MPMKIRVWMVAAHLAVAAGCTRAESGYPAITPGDVARVTGQPVPTAFLLFDPQDCFTCAAQIGRWMDLRRHSPGRVAIVLTEEPSAGERRALAARRIPVDGIVRRKALKKESAGGRVFIYRAGKLLASGRLDDTTVVSTLRQEFPR